MWSIETVFAGDHVNLWEEQFINLVMIDIERFVQESADLDSCLVFPPLNNRRRYFVHTVAHLYYLRTFTVAKDNLRKLTVACSFLDTNKSVYKTYGMMDSAECKTGAISKSKKIPIRPAAPIYVPPAIRKVIKSPILEQKHEGNENAETCDTKDTNKPFENLKDTRNISLDNSINQHDSSTDESHKKEVIVTDKNLSSQNNSINNIPQINEIDKDIVPDCNEFNEKNSTHTNNIDLVEELQCNSSNIFSNISDNEYTSTIITEDQNNDILTNTEIEAVNYSNTDKDSWAIEENDHEHEGILRVSKEINRRNKKIFKQSFNNSDILIISDTKKSENNDPIDINKLHISNSIDLNELHTSNPNKLDSKSETKFPVECWEDLLNDGQLDSEIKLKITSRIGNVHITTTKEDYKEYSLRSNLIGNFSHVLELYDFPKEFETRDLVSIIDSFTNGIYHIKWVDDTHALGVFSSGFVVNELLKITHPLLKLRVLNDASKQSIEKAIRNPNAMVPAAARPKTCPQTARRMVSGALGLKLHNSKEERAQEIKILREAKEKKKLSAKLQDDAWEGRTST